MDIVEVAGRITYGQEQWINGRNARRGVEETNLADKVKYNGRMKYSEGPRQFVKKNLADIVQKS